MDNVRLYIGNEELMIKNKIDNVIAQASPGAFNLTTYDMEIDSMTAVLNDCMTMPFLSDKKVVIMRHPVFLSKDTSVSYQGLMDYLDNPNESCLLIIDASGVELDESKDIVIKLRKKAQVTEQSTLSDVEMKGWLKRQFGVLGLEIEENAVELFFEYVHNDLIKAKGEVEKLLNYVGDRKVVTIRDVASVVSDEGETNVFALIKAINQKDKNKTMEIYYSLLNAGNDQIKLLNLIYRSMKDSYTSLKLIENGKNQNEIASFLGVSPGRAYYIMKDAKNFDIKTLEEDLIKIGDLDFKIKSGLIDKVSGMELFLFGI